MIQIGLRSCVRSNVSSGPRLTRIPNGFIGRLPYTRALFTKPGSSTSSSSSPPPTHPHPSNTDPLRQPPPNAILKRVPKFMHQYVTQFANAPFSHVTAFVILHELTAIVPLVGIWYGLHNYVDHSSAIFAADLPSFAMDKASALVDKCLDLAGIAQISLQEKTRLVMEGAYSYAIVKALFPVRVMISLWGMPYFARWFVLPFTKMFSKRKPKTSENQTNQLKKVESKRITKPRL